jgi:hypothetical protein
VSVFQENATRQFRTRQFGFNLWKGKLEMGMHVTHVAPTRSMAARGRVSTHLGGGRGAFYDRRGLPGLPCPAPLAGRLPLSALRWEQRMAPARRPIGVR